MAKGEIAHHEQFILWPQCFQFSFLTIKLSFMEIFQVFFHYVFKVVCCRFVVSGKWIKAITINSNTCVIHFHSNSVLQSFQLSPCSPIGRDAGYQPEVVSSNPRFRRFTKYAKRQASSIGLQSMWKNQPFVCEYCSVEYLLEERQRYVN